MSAAGAAGAGAAPATAAFPGVGEFATAFKSLRELAAEFNKLSSDENLKAIFDKLMENVVTPAYEFVKSCSAEQLAIHAGTLAALLVAALCIAHTVLVWHEMSTQVDNCQELTNTAIEKCAALAPLLVGGVESGDYSRKLEDVINATVALRNAQAQVTMSETANSSRIPGIWIKFGIALLGVSAIIAALVGVPILVPLYAAIVPVVAGIVAGTVDLVDYNVVKDKLTTMKEQLVVAEERASVVADADV
jgi:hypothetical protein